MTRRLGQSITAALVGCSQSAAVSIYQKWSKEGTVVNRQQVHELPRLIDACVEQRLAHVVRSGRWFQSSLWVWSMEAPPPAQLTGPKGSAALSARYHSTFEFLVESMPGRLRTVLAAEWGRHSTRKVVIMFWLCECCFVCVFHSHTSGCACTATSLVCLSGGQRVCSPRRVALALSQARQQQLSQRLHNAQHCTGMLLAFFISVHACTLKQYRHAQVYTKKKITKAQRALYLSFPHTHAHT